MENKYKIKSRLWIEANDDVLLGEGRVALLKSIQKLGSLSKAAKSNNISYKKAWSMIDSVNKAALNPVVETSIGGKGGGGAVITDYGLKIIAAFDNINKKCWKFLDKEISKLDNL